MSHQSDQFFGPRDPNEKAPLPLGTLNLAPPVPFEFGRPTYAPGPPPFSPRGALQAAIAAAEERVKRCDAANTDKQGLFNAAKLARANFPDDPHARDQLTKARAEAEAATDDLDAARAALDLARQRLADAESSGELDEFETAHREQMTEAFMARMAPLGDGAFALGGNFARLVTAARAVISAVGVNRARAVALAHKLGVPYRPSSVDINDAARALGQAFRRGFREAGERDLEIASWTRGT